MPKKNTRDWTPEELEDINALYKKGYENTTIAEKYHCHWATIGKLIRGNKKDKIDIVFEKIYGKFPTPNEKKQYIKYKSD